MPDSEGKPPLVIIPSILPSGLLKSFTEGVQGLVATLLSKHMPGGDDHRDGPLNELEAARAVMPAT